MLSFGGIGLVSWLYIATGADWLFYTIFFVAVISLYVMYLTYYEGFIRYEKFLHIKGHEVEAELTLSDRDGSKRKTPMAFYQKDPSDHGVYSPVYGNFFWGKKNFEDGSIIKAYLLSTGEFLLLEDPLNYKKSK